MKRHYERQIHKFSQLVLDYADALISGQCDTSAEYRAIMDAYCVALKGVDNSDETEESE